jgi:hypothetical protein
MCNALNRARSPARQWLALASLIALSMAFAPANGDGFKCTDAAGKIFDQAKPCPSSAETTLKVQAPAAPTSATNSTTAGSRGTRMPAEADFKGPRETWERLGLAIRRGDKDAALKELTPMAQQRLASVFDTLGSKTTPFDVEYLGSIRSVTLSGEGLATITTTRKKADGTYVHQMMLIRGADGRWRIDNM